MEPLGDDPRNDAAPGRLRLRIVKAPPGMVPPKLELPLIVKDDGPITVGRLDDNDLVLPDDNLHVSRCHCLVDEQDGVWLLQNRSAKNGAWVNDKLLAEGEVTVITAGDVIRVVDYTLHVEADASSDAPEWETDPRLEPEVGAVEEPPFPPGPTSHEQAGIAENEVAPIPEPLPPDRGKTSEGTDRAGHEVRPTEEPAPGPREDLLAAFLAGAGLERLPDGADPAKAMRALGESSRVFLRTLAHLVAARCQLESDFRITTRQITPTRNNPFKFSVDERHMLGLLLGETPPGFSSAPAAMEDACRDLVEHQIALLAEFQAQLKLVMQRLSPKEIASATKGSLLGGKARLWERYEAVYAEVQHDVENTLAGPLGQALAAAYEAQARRGG